MENLPMKLDHSRAALVHSSRRLIAETLGAGVAFVEQTREAGEAFVAETRDASRHLAERTKAARADLIARALGASEDWMRGLTTEAEHWRSYVRASRDKLGGGARSFLSTEPLQRSLLQSMRRTLNQVDDRLEHRLGDLTEEREPNGQRARAAPQPTARKTDRRPRAAQVRRKAPARRPSRSTPARPPLRGYDEMTAKQLVSRFDAMTQAQLKAVLAYERKNKQRATVLRAAEQRLAA